MDLGSVERNLRTGLYSNSLEFATDVRRIWLNALRYNEAGTDLCHMAVEMATYFERHFRKVENRVFSVK
jgi:hypothetical protein